MFDLFTNNLAGFILSLINLLLFTDKNLEIQLGYTPEIFSIHNNLIRSSHICQLIIIFGQFVNL